MGGESAADAPAVTTTAPDGRDVVAYAIFFGLLGGFAEAVRAVGAIVWTHRAAGEVVAPEVFWMAPAAACVALLLLGVLVVLASRIAGRPEGRTIAPGLFVGVCVFGFALSLSLGLHPLAIAVLSAGVGTVLGRAVVRRHDTWRGIARRMAVLGTVAAVAWAIWIPQSRRLAETRALSALPAAKADAPNVLLIVWDTVRALSLSLHGYERETTPTLDRLAGSSVVFDRAVSSAPWTLPSHATLFTGLYEHGHGATRDSPLGEDVPTLAEALGARGYRTGGFAANTYWLGRPFGLHRGFHWYEDSWFEDTGDGLSPVFEAVARSWWISNAVYRATGSQARRRRRIQNVSAGAVNEAVLEWVDRIGSGRPFFAFMNLYDAHEPYSGREPTGFLFSDGEPRFWWDYTRPDTISRTDLEELREAYDAAIYHLDFRLAELLDELASRGVLENTLVIVTSDHGETLGEHGPDLIGHSKYVYYEVLNVPLVFRFPRRFGGGTRRSAAVSHVDVPATILDIVDAGGRDGPSLPGTSLLSLLLAAGGDSVPPPAGLSPALSQATPADWQLEFSRWPVSRGPLFSLIEGDAHYVVDVGGGEELYDLSGDPWATRSLLAEPGGQEAASRLRTRLRQLLDDRPDVRRP
ncbi:MAG: sulfatase-like hydrolase/transferase [Gemmatimonadota bacterium]|nr:sulfatase-like hydrolase/transferase [Gemmatimonadota bacterium]